MNNQFNGFVTNQRMKYFEYFVVILFISFGKISAKTEPVVTTTYGKIRGYQPDNFSFYAFQGIPYARPPLGSLRFQAPVEPTPWNSTLTFKKFGDSCPQIKNNTVIGSEDCLTLNVFTNNLTDRVPVMVFFHGGAYITGSSSQFCPEYLLTEPIVLVTVNYRLGVLGFFSTQDKYAYGNSATKDQHLALEWVQKNIKEFGGDPLQVTIFGESAGSDSVSLLQLSKRSKGLFHKIIGESGSAINPRYIQRQPLYYAHQLAKYFNISINRGSKEIVEGLQKIPFDALVEAADQIPSPVLQAGPFFPVIEVANKDAILTQPPYQLLQTGEFNQIPFMFGYNTNESSLGFKILTTEEMKAFDSDYKLFYTISLNNPNKSETIGKIVRDFFMGNSSSVLTNRNKFGKFLAQEILVRGIRKDIDFQRKFSTGYFYRFSYKGKHTVPSSGVGHAEELQYIFYNKHLHEDDKLTQKRMTALWTNFARFGTPTPHKDSLLQNVSWEECGKEEDSVNFLDIGENLVKGTNPDEAEYKFWLKLFRNYGVPPFETY